METRLKKRYKEEVVPELMEKFKYKNVNQVPKLLKISVNMGVGRDNKDAKFIEVALKEVAMVTGQKPVITRAKKAIAAFNLRKGDMCGIMVTLRREIMYEFLDRFVSAALPRVRDFNGLPAKSTDGKGCYTVGVREQVIFPEIDYNSIYKTTGMNLTFVTNAKSPEETVGLLRSLGLPIREG